MFSHSACSPPIRFPKTVSFLAFGSHVSLDHRCYTILRFVFCRVLVSGRFLPPANILIEFYRSVASRVEFTTTPSPCSLIATVGFPGASSPRLHWFCVPRVGAPSLFLEIRVDVCAPALMFFCVVCTHRSSSSISSIGYLT